LNKQKSKLLFTSRLGYVLGKQTNVLFPNGVGKLYDIVPQTNIPTYHAAS